MASIKLTYEEFNRFQKERETEYKGERPITMKLKAAGVIPYSSGLYVSNEGGGMVISNGPLDKEQTEIEADMLRQIVEVMDRKNVPELKNIFNELLEEWFESEVCIIGHTSGSIEKDMEELSESKAEYKRKFAEALGGGLSDGLGRV